MHITHSNTLFIVHNIMHVMKTDKKLFAHILFTYFIFTFI